MTIVEFLRARLDEDEAAARRVHQPYRLYACNDGCIEEPIRNDELFGEHQGEYEQEDGEDALPNHHNSWALIYDPARVLREVEAKRAMVGLHDQGGERWEGFPRADKQVPYCLHDQQAAPCPMIRLLAQPFADHPDYDPAWAPTVTA